MIALDFLGNLAPLAVDLILVIGALSILVTDIILPAGDKRILGYGTLAVLTAALVGCFVLDIDGVAISGAYVGDGMSRFLKVLFIVGAYLSVLGAQHQLSQDSTRRQGEYFELLLFSLVGMTLLAGTRDLILLVVCFELMGIPLYVLAGWRSKDKLAVEGALKFFMVGAVSSVTILFGLSFLYGLSGTTNIPEMAAWVGAHRSAGVLVGGALALAGMGFKLGVFPFHMWVPDTYESADTPLVAYLSVAPKAAGLGALIQLLYAADGALLKEVSVVLIILATVTLVSGNLLALNQSNIKRLLGYSGVAHMGFLLMALSCGNVRGLQMLLFYLAAYLFTNIGTFLVVHTVQQAGGDDTIDSFSGLGRRSGWLSFAMLLFLLSLAGIPFVAGFWAKLYIFLAAWEAGLGWLVVLGAALSVVGLYYYLQIARAIFMTEPPTDERIQVEWHTNLAIGICLAFVMGMGLMPRPFVEAAELAARAFLQG